MNTIGQLSQLAIYPLKSAAGVPLDSAHAGPRGLEHDRRWAAAEPSGRLLTQRDIPRLAAVKAQATSQALVLRAPDMSELTVPVPANPAAARTRWSLWGESYGGTTTTPEAAAWLSAYLQRPAQLLHCPDEEVRWQEGKPYRASLTFVDGNPYHLINLASVQAVREATGSDIVWPHFRPNLVVDGFPPFAEDYWREITIGPLNFQVVESCARCSIVNTTQEGFGRGEPLRAITKLRQSGKHVLFGQHLILADSSSGGLMRVGDRVEVKRIGQSVNPAY